LPTLRTVRPKWALSETQAAALLEKLPLLAKTMAMLASGTDDLVFAAWSGKPISPNNVLPGGALSSMRGLGISRATWLRFRRTYASWAHDVGMPGKVIAQLMGHMKVDPPKHEQFGAPIDGDRARHRTARSGKVGGRRDRVAR
jgi:hypothetical protein